MHDAARKFCEQYKNDNYGFALDIGGRDVNGHCRDLWSKMEWTIIDNTPPESENFAYLYADAVTWEPDKFYDLVLCTEVFEHTPLWPAIINTAHDALNTGGLFIVTCAGPGRPPHSAIDGAELREDEYYRWLLPHELGITLRQAGFRCTTSYNPDAKDVYAYAVKC